MSAFTLWFVGVVQLLSCQGDEPIGGKSQAGVRDTQVDGEIDADADADADSDADSDADADSGSDSVHAVQTQDDADRMLVEFVFARAWALHGAANIDAEAGTIGGEVTLDTTYDGAVECDVTSRFTGSTNPDFTGVCADCDLAFGIDDAMLDMGASTGDCYANPMLTYVADDSLVDLGLIYDAEFASGFYGEFTYSDILGAIYWVDYRPYGPGLYGPYFQFTFYTSETRPERSLGSVSLDGTSLTWSLDEERAYYRTSETFYNWCESTHHNPSVAATNLEGTNYGGNAYYGSVDCASVLTDVWVVDATSGQILRVSMDTVSADTAFDGSLMVNGPDTCTLIGADDAFACSYEPAAKGCPSVVVPINVDGTYEVVVWANGSCTGETADYKLELRLD